MDRFEKYLDKVVKQVLDETLNKKVGNLVSEIEKKSKLHGGQHKIDVAEPKGKITADDFKKLRTKKDMKEYTMGDDQIEKVEPYGDFSTDSPKKVGKVKNVGYNYERKVAKEFNENDMEEGNAFSGALAKAKKDGKSSFEVDGKTYEVKEGQVYPEKTDDGDFLSNFIKNALKRNTRLYPKKDKEQTMVPKKDYNDFDEYKDDDDEYSSHMFIGEEGEKDNFIQKATKKMEKKGTSGKFGQWCKKEGLDKDGEVTKKCIDKAMKSDDSKVVKMANFAKNIGGFKGAKHESVQMTESEVIELIERLVMEQNKIAADADLKKVEKEIGAQRKLKHFD